MAAGLMIPVRLSFWEIGHMPNLLYDTRERRRQPRSGDENLASLIIQAMLRDPSTTQQNLEELLRDGAIPELVHRVLEMAAQCSEKRGVELGATIGAVRSHLRQAGFAV
jgi:hypothetical protein